MLKYFKNMEFSKRLLLFVQSLIIALFILTAVATFKGYVDALVALITGVFSLASIAFGFYFWKAKAENIRKYTRKLSQEDIEKVAAAYSAIFKAVEDNENEGI
jgi:amino acid permease